MTMIAKFKLFLFFALTSFGIAVNLFILVLFHDWSYSNLITTSAGFISDSALLPSFQNDTDGDARYTNALLPSPSNASREDGPGFAHCFYRMYNASPSLGLPIVAEVFASSDRTQILVVAESHIQCHDEDREAHNFYSVPGARNVTFDCIYEADGSRTTSLPVHPLHNGYKRLMPYIVIQCPVPSHLISSLPLSRSRITNSFLSLQANMNHITGGKLNDGDRTDGTDPFPKLSHLPICSHAWPPEPEDESFPIAVAPKKRHKVSLMTRVRMEYERGDNNEQLVVSPLKFAAWLEYHVTLGMDQIYIYDNSPDRYNSTIRLLCQPYVQRGLVTYIHYPMGDQLCDHRVFESQEAKGNLKMGQIISSNSVLRRYENETEWMAHWDIDEYLVLPSKSLPTTLDERQAALYDFIDHHGSRDRLYDEVSIRRLTFGICKSITRSEPNGTAATIPSTLLPMDMKRCHAENFDKVNKGIYRSSTVFFLLVHMSFMAMDRSGGTAKETVVNFIRPTHGYLAHYRDGNAAGSDFPIVPSSLQEPFLDEKWVHVLKENLLSRGFDPELVGPSSLSFS